MFQVVHPWWRAAPTFSFTAVTLSVYADRLSIGGWWRGPGAFLPMHLWVLQKAASGLKSKCFAADLEQKEIGTADYGLHSCGYDFHGALAKAFENAISDVSDECISDVSGEFA